MNTEAGIARLRESKEKSMERLRAEGHELGKAWALNDAEYEQLERVAKLEESVGGEWMAPGALHWLIEAIDESLSADELFGTDSPSDDQVEGFIEGAAEVFAEA
ncbi:hypothetical protein MASR2M16_14790 [Thauera terpenica]|jgi:hypothetical protein